MHLSRAGQTLKLMLMITAPLYLSPVSNLGSLSTTLVCPCRFHPCESRGAAGRSCINEWEVLYSSASNSTGLRFLRVSLVLAAHPQLWPSLPKALASGREFNRGEVRLPCKPWREREVVENTAALLQHLSQAELPGSCARTEDAWWDFQMFWLPLLPTTSSKQFGTTSLFNSCFPLQAHRQNELAFLSQKRQTKSNQLCLKILFSVLSLLFFFPLSFCAYAAVSTAMTKYWQQHSPNKKNEHKNKYELKQRAFQWQGSQVCSKTDGSKKAPRLGAVGQARLLAARYVLSLWI